LFDHPQLQSLNVDGRRSTSSCFADSKSLTIVELRIFWRIATSQAPLFPHQLQITGNSPLMKFYSKAVVVVLSTMMCLLDSSHVSTLVAFVFTSRYR